MTVPFDVEALVAALLAFQENVSFHLTDEPPLPPEIAGELWKAHNSVIRALSVLEARYGKINHDSWTIYAPTGLEED
jgi:hypothetical protein